MAGCRRAGEWQQGDSLGGPGTTEDRPLAGGFKATALWEGLRGFSGPPSSSSRGCSSGFRCGRHQGQHTPDPSPAPALHPCPAPCILHPAAPPSTKQPRPTSHPLPHCLAAASPSLPHISHSSISHIPTLHSSLPPSSHPTPQPLWVPVRVPGAGSQGPGLRAAAAAGRRAPAGAGTGSVGTQAAAPCAAGGRQGPGPGTSGATAMPGPSRRLPVGKGFNQGLTSGSPRRPQWCPRRPGPTSPASPTGPHLPPLHNQQHPQGPHLPPLHTQKHPQDPYPNPSSPKEPTGTHFPPCSPKSTSGDPTFFPASLQPPQYPPAQGRGARCQPHPVCAGCHGQGARWAG